MAYRSKLCAVCSYATRAQPVAPRFWKCIDKSGPVPVHRPDLGACWIWTGARCSNGYGEMSVNCKHVNTHRIAWKLRFGPIPDDLSVLHRCDNRGCCRPDHLFLGTDLDNQRDCVAKGRSNRGEAHGLAKLTWVIVREMRRLYAAGIDNVEIGRRFGVNPRYVWEITTGKRWQEPVFSGDQPFSERVAAAKALLGDEFALLRGADN